MAEVSDAILDVVPDMSDISEAIEMKESEEKSEEKPTVVESTEVILQRKQEMMELANTAAERSMHLPVGEVFYLIDQGFTEEVGQYEVDKWIDGPENEDIMDKLMRYRQIVGPEEFQSLASTICFLRLSEKTCACCGKVVNLKLCLHCKLTFYCSLECQRIHWSVHRKWCCRRFRDVRDDGPAGIVLFDKRSGGV